MLGLPSGGSLVAFDLLLVAYHHQGPLVVAFIDLEKAYDQLPRVILWHMLAEELKVPVDIRTGIEALYYLVPIHS